MDPDTAKCPGGGSDQFDHGAAFSALHRALQEQQAFMAQHFQKQQQRLDCFLEQFEQTTGNSPAGLQHLSISTDGNDIEQPLSPVAEGGEAEEATTSPSRKRFSVTKEDEELELKQDAATYHQSLGGAEVITTSERHKARLEAVVESPMFEVFFGIAIFSNAILIGVEVSFARSQSDESESFFRTATIAYALLFTAELLLRLLVYGKSFFCSEHWQWNWLDVLIVACSLWEVIVELLSAVRVQIDTVSGLTSIRIVRILRITRMVRIMKVARIMRFVKALRTLVSSIAHTLKSLFWALVLLVLIMYVFGILFTQAVTDFVEDSENDMSLELTTAIDQYWYGLLPSMLTLFMAITGGTSWELPLYPLSMISAVWASIFLFYIAFAYLAVLNVVTGVFCEAAIESAASDHEMAMQSIMENRKAHADKVRSLFANLDYDGSGTITLAELEHHINSDVVKDYFEMLELDVRDAWTFFRLLDQDGGSAIDLEEFLWGCMHLRGNAKALDLARLQHDHTWLLRKLTDFMSHVEEQFSKQARQQSRVSRCIAPVVLSPRIQSQSGGDRAKFDVPEPGLDQRADVQQSFPTSFLM